MKISGEYGSTNRGSSISPFALLSSSFIFSSLMNTEGFDSHIYGNINFSSFSSVMSLNLD